VRIALLASSLFLVVCSRAQTMLPEWGQVFLQNEVAEIALSIHPDTLAVLLADTDGEDEHEYPAAFSYSSSTLQQTFGNIGVRLRGNTSLNAAKKSFKVSFNSFTNGAQWLGVEKLNLIANQNDPSLIRAKVCWDAMRSYGLPGSRASYVRLTINGDYMGVYLNVEHIDENFAKAYFDDGTGNLWKCLYPANLNFISNQADAYKLEVFGRRVYDLKTNTFQDDYAALNEFVRVLNTTPTADLPCALRRVFNVDDYLKYLALDVLLGNWDGAAYNQNNFYLYHNQRTGLLEYIPYDLDNTLGIDWLGEDWAERSVYAWSPSDQNRPIYEKMMAVPEFRNTFSAYLSAFTSPEAVEQMTNDALFFHNLITPHALEDPYREMDFGFTDNDFLNALDVAWGDQVDYSVIDYLQQRAASASNQLDNFSSPIYHHSLELETIAPHVIRARMRSSVSSENCLLVCRQVSTGAFSTYPFSTTSLPASWNEEVNQVLITDWVWGDSYECGVVPIGEWNAANPELPCITRFFHTGQSILPLMINEVMPANATTIADNAGQFDDWLELYNAGTTPIFLGNKFITDNPQDWNKWKLPNLTLNPNDFLLLWADGDPEQGFNHLDFRLDANGEFLGLSEVISGAPMWMDTLTFPAVPTGFSYGRNGDGQDQWIFFSTPTPDASNTTVEVINPEDSLPVLYPNPTRDVVHFTAITSARIYSLSGQLVAVLTAVPSYSVNHLPNGMYTVVFENGGSLRFLVQK
jgi:hypothetical protein